MFLVDNLIKKKRLLLCFSIIFIVACDRESKTTEFCARLYANATTREENFNFARDKKILPELPKKKRYESDKNPIIYGRNDFLENECGFAWFPTERKYKYKECVSNDYYFNTRKNIERYCDYLSRGEKKED